MSSPPHLLGRRAKPVCFCTKGGSIFDRSSVVHGRHWPSETNFVYNFVHFRLMKGRGTSLLDSELLSIQVDFAPLTLKLP